MAKDKKGFVLYADVIHTCEHLTDEQAGILFKHILSYVNDENPTTDDILIKLAFEPIKRQLKRDLKRYEDKRKQWSEAGKRSAEVRKANKKQRTLTNVKSRSTDSTVIVNDTVNVIDTVKDINNRMADFKKSLYQYLEDNKGKYLSGMYKEFFEYWTEHNEKGKKMRFEYAKNQPFNIKRRLATWNSRQKKEKNTAKKESAATILQRKYGIK